MLTLSKQKVRVALYPYHFVAQNKHYSLSFPLLFEVTY